MKRIVLLLMAVGLSLLADGCAASAPTSPKTFPVTGKVDAGDRSLENAMVVFESPEGSATGTVDAGGNFSLTSVIDSVVVKGARPGVYQVSIHLTSSANAADPGQAQAAQPITLPQSFTVEPKDNHFVLEVPLPSK